MRQVLIQSKSESSEHHINIFYDEENRRLEGKIEYKYYGKTKQYVSKKITFSDNEIAVEEHFEDETFKDETKYTIRMPDLGLIIDYDISEKVLNRIDKIFDELESKEEVKVVYSKNVRKVESKDVFVEIANNKMSIESKELEIDVNSTNNLINDDMGDFYEEYTDENARDALGLIKIRIHDLLTPLLYTLSELRCVFLY